MFLSAKERTSEIREQMRDGKGGVLLETAPKAALPAHTRLAGVITLHPGCSIGSHAHEGETEIFTFFAGHGQAEDQGKIIPVGPGDMLFTGGGATHGVENTGDEDLIFSAVIVTEA